MTSRNLLALFLIAIGALLLLSTFNMITADFWSLAWALAIIFVGLGLLVKRKTPQIQTIIDSEPLAGATSASIKIKHGAGSLRIKSALSGDMLFSGSFRGTLDKKTRRSNSQVDVTLQMSSDDWTQWLWPWNWFDGHMGAEWEIDLNKDIPLSLALETGASDTHVDLTNAMINDFTLKTGASSTSIIMSSHSQFTKAIINSGAASVNIRIPEGVSASISGSMGLGSLIVDENRFAKSGSSFVSPDYADAPHKIEINIEGGVGAVTIK